MSKERRRRNLQILFSVVAAVALWLFVAFSENTPITMWERNVTVDVTGEDALAEKGLVMVMANLPSVDVQMSGSRRGFFQKSEGDVTAQIDLSRIDEAGTYTVNVKSDVSIRGANVLETSPGKIDVVIEPLITVTKKVEVKTSGSCAEGFSVSAIDCPTVQVTGPQSVVSGLTVTADAVSVDGAEEDVIAQTKVHLTNSNGGEVRRKDSSMNTTTVEVTCHVQYEKVVPITVETTGAGQDGYKYEVLAEPDEVMIFGNREVLAGIDEITTMPVDVRGITRETTKTIRLRLPEGVTVNREMQVNVTIHPTPIPIVP